MKIRWFLPIGAMLVSGMLGAASYGGDQNDQQNRSGSRMYNSQTRYPNTREGRRDFNRQSEKDLDYRSDDQDENMNDREQLRNSGRYNQDRNFDDRNMYRENIRFSDGYVRERNRYRNPNAGYYRSGYYYHRPYYYREYYYPTYSYPQYYDDGYYNPDYYYNDGYDDGINVGIPGIGGVHLGN